MLSGCLGIHLIVELRLDSKEPESWRLSGNNLGLRLYSLCLYSNGMFSKCLASSPFPLVSRHNTAVIGSKSSMFGSPGPWCSTNNTTAMIYCDDPTYVLRDESLLDGEIDDLGSSAETRAGFIKGEDDRADTHLYGRFTSWLLLFSL